ncbi:MAG: leucine-rich repeat domain-containing protein, partial [Clostridia bacterium]|nr:leucine-rich repeat domain-containing protein [Clostridia bacterium]
MKKRLYFLALLCAFAALLAVYATAANVTINSTNFPDANFRSYVSANCDTNNDGTLSASEIAEVTEISFDEEGISNLKGIETFTSLEILYCSDNQLTSLDVSKNTALKELYCYSCALTSLNVTDCPKLETLLCDDNQLKSLDVSTNTVLATLACSDNQLSMLDVN